MFTAGLLAWKDCPKRARRLADEQAVEAAAARTGTRIGVMYAHANSSPGRRWLYVKERSAQQVRCGKKRMGGAMHDRLARAGYSVILVTALLIAHDRPRI
ncbi:hypothetical protein [Burkholderia pyrrocinia]|uniref:hypothetical protein n=1 Tax=Burkholderia pyrrocinia TaxID=60550 RepID=UPI002AAF9DE5|nr:hypothetical protein [Burkholderia pyrrocinia]